MNPTIRRAAAIGVVCILIATTGSAQTLPFLSGRNCSTERARALPAPASCLADAGITMSSGVLDTLIERVRGETSTGRFDAAESLLDCAEAVVGDEGSPADRHRLMRQRAVLDYRRERLPQALAGFECALSLARSREASADVSSDLNAVGSTLRRLGDYRGALAHLSQALDQSRAAGDDTAAVLNNLGDVYRDLGEPEEALRHYRESAQRYLDTNRSGHAAHVLESMAVVELERGRATEATAALLQALTAYQAAAQHDYTIRVHGWLIRAALANGAIADAARWRAAGEAIASERGLSLPLSFVLQAARSERLAGAAGAAVSRVRAALQRDVGNEGERAELHAELAAAQEAQGDWLAALSSQRRAHDGERRDAAARHDRALAWLRTQFETAERDRTIASLEAERLLQQAQLRQRTLMVWLLGAGALTALLVVSLLWQRRGQREREQQAAVLARQDVEIARYRREAAALLEDRQQLRTLLDSRHEALCLLDADGVVLAANRAASMRFGAGLPEVIGQPIGQHVVASDRDALHTALENMEDSSAQQVSLRLVAQTSCVARLSPWPEGDGLIVLELADAEAPAGAMPNVDGDAESGMAADGALRECFRRHLVALMLAAIDVWERGTRRSRLDLAEASRIWRVAVDDGRLRARSMERYLNVSRLPQQPRWRDVLRTAYYVLESCEMEAGVRDDLQQQIDRILAYTRRRALM